MTQSIRNNSATTKTVFKEGGVGEGGGAGFRMARIDEDTQELAAQICVGKHFKYR